MKISVLTIFPDFFPAVLSEGMIRAAREKGRLEVAIVALRDFTDDSHRTTDDYPFGGGAGMIMKVEPIDRALASLGVGEKGVRPAGTRVTLLSPQGRAFTQDGAIEYSGLAHLVLVCGRYKGVDERVSLHLVDEELSVGDFVLSGGEPAALCVLDAIARLLPGVVSTFDSVESDSFHSGLLDSPYYTRPASYRGWSVPDVLLSGHHAKIARTRREESLSRTAARRPDLLERASLAPEDRRYLATFRRETVVTSAVAPALDASGASDAPAPVSPQPAAASRRNPPRPKPKARAARSARREPPAPRKPVARAGSAPGKPPGRRKASARRKSGARDNSARGRE